MELEFEDFTGYFEAPPTLEQLQGKVLDRRKKGNKLLVVIPSYKDNERLSQLLAELKRQTMGQIDVAVIYAAEDRFLEFPGLSMLHVKRKLEMGFAGAAYLGQLIATRDNYKYVIVTDVDKYPASKDSIKALYLSAEETGAECIYGKCCYEDVFYPSINRHFHLKKPIALRPWRFAWGLVRVDYMKKAGLVLLPLYMGGDDIEYAYRLYKAGGRHVLLDECIVRIPNVKRELIFSYVKNGGRVNYYYSNMLALYGNPQMFFRKFPFPTRANPIQRLSDLAGLFRIFLAIDWFSMVLMQRRMPALRAYDEKIAEGRFGIFRWSKTESDVGITQVKPTDMNANLAIKSPYIKYPLGISGLERVSVDTNIGKLKLFVKSLAKPYRPVICASEITDIWLCLFDTLYVYDESRKVFYEVAWKRKLFGWGLASAVLEIEAKCLFLLIKAFFLEFSGGPKKGAFYGSEMVKKYCKAMPDLSGNEKARSVYLPKTGSLKI